MNFKYWMDAIYDQLFNQPVDHDAELMRKLTRLITREVNAIDDLFIKYEVDARIDRRCVVASDTGGFVRYKVLNTGKVSKLTTLNDDLSMLISELRDEDVTVRVRKPRLIIEVPYPLDIRTLDWEVAPVGNLRKFQALVGMDYSALDVAPIILDWSKDDTNLLIGGTTGGGKTNLVKLILASLAYSTSPADAHIVVVNPKGISALNALRELPHVSVYNEQGDCAKAIAMVYEEKERRLHRRDGRKIFLVVEELAELLSKEAGAASDQLRSIAQIGRECGIHLIATTQKPHSDVFDSILKANLPIRVAFQVTSQTDMKVITGLDNIEWQALRERGSAFFVRDGRERRIQTHLVSDDEIFSIVDGIAAKWLHVEPYRPSGDQRPKVADGLPTGVTTDQVNRVLANFAMDDIFDADGNPKRGVKARLIRHIFGGDAKTGGANDSWATSLIGYLSRQEMPAE